ncbi:MAG: VOC family protein [Gaiellaceae bacterium]
MKLEGIHHVTAITGDAPGNVDFYVRVLGLRLVKKSVNQDDPTVYHLFYADEEAKPGSDITFFEYPGAMPGRVGAGMVHTVEWRVASPESISFWESRLAGEGIAAERDDSGGLTFADPEGLRHRLVVVATDDEPLTADHPEIPKEHALQGFNAVHAYTRDPERSSSFLEALEFSRNGEAWEARGKRRGGLYAYDRSDEQGVPGAGTVHHVAWASTPEEHEAWQQRVLEAGGSPTPVIDRFYFRSIYFREPSGVLFEIATIGPGFDVDEPLEHLGERLSLPPNYENLRGRLERVLTPLPDPRALRAAK